MYSAKLSITLSVGAAFLDRRHFHEVLSVSSLLCLSTMVILLMIVVYSSVFYQP